MNAGIFASNLTHIREKAEMLLEDPDLDPNDYSMEELVKDLKRLEEQFPRIEKTL